MKVLQIESMSIARQYIVLRLNNFIMDEILQCEFITFKQVIIDFQTDFNRYNPISTRVNFVYTYDDSALSIILTLESKEIADYHVTFNLIKRGSAWMVDGTRWMSNHASCLNERTLKYSLYEKFKCFHNTVFSIIHTQHTDSILGYTCTVRSYGLELCSFLIHIQQTQGTFLKMFKKPKETIISIYFKYPIDSFSSRWIGTMQFANTNKAPLGRVENYTDFMDCIEKALVYMQYDHQIEIWGIAARIVNLLERLL